MADTLARIALSDRAVAGEVVWRDGRGGAVSVGNFVRIAGVPSLYVAVCDLQGAAFVALADDSDGREGAQGGNVRQMVATTTADLVSVAAEAFGFDMPHPNSSNESRASFEPEGEGLK